MKDVIIINLIDVLIDGLKYFIPPLSVAIISGVFTYRVNKNTQKFKKEINESNKILTKEINESNEKLKEKLLKDRIQADVTALSRIKWIEEVRKTSADYISALNEYYFHHDNEEKKENFIELSYRMKLYFSNNFNDNMSNKNEEDEKRIRNLAIEILEKSTDALKGNANINDTVYDIHSLKEFIENKDGNTGKSPFINRMFDDNLRIMLSDGILEEKNKNEMVDTTIDVISTYLKIEWDRAKNNE